MCQSQLLYYLPWGQFRRFWQILVPAKDWCNVISSCGDFFFPEDPNFIWFSNHRWFRQYQHLGQRHWLNLTNVCFQQRFGVMLSPPVEMFFSFLAKIRITSWFKWLFETPSICNYLGKILYLLIISTICGTSWMCEINSFTAPHWFHTRDSRQFQP